MTGLVLIKKVMEPFSDLAGRDGGVWVLRFNGDGDLHTPTMPTVQTGPSARKDGVMDKDENLRIDSAIRECINDLDLRADLLGQGQTIVYIDSDEALVKETPDGHVTVLAGPGEWS